MIAAQWNYERKAMLATQLAISLGFNPETPTPNQHDTYLAKEERSDRSLQYLLVAMLKERDGDKCYLCQTTLTPGQTCIEHIIPLCYGGTNEPHNVALACSNCNGIKSNRYVSLSMSSGAPCYHLHRAIGG